MFGVCLMSGRLAAIFAADVVGYSAMMADDESGILAALKSVRHDVIDPAISAHQGWLVKRTGDGTLVEFTSVVDAVNCAADIQNTLADRDVVNTGERTIRQRIGVSLGDVILDGDDLYGDAVNIAARLEAEAPPGGIFVSDDAFGRCGAKRSCVSRIWVKNP